MGFDGFIQLDGIKGDSTDDKHNDWIEVLAFNHSVTQVTGGSMSAQGTHAGGRVNIGDFHIVKRLDAASPTIFLRVCDGKPIPQVIIELCRAMGEKTVFMKYTLKDVIISASRPTGAAEGEDLIPTEEIELRAAEYHLEYTPTDPRGGGKTGPAVQSAWSTLQNKAM